MVIASMDFDAQYDDALTYSCELKGAGDLTKVGAASSDPEQGEDNSIPGMPGADGNDTKLAADRAGCYAGHEPDPERHFQSVLFDQTGHEYSLERYRQQYFLHVEADAADR
jgi:hypothetical protein